MKMRETAHTTTVQTAELALVDARSRCRAQYRPALTRPDTPDPSRKEVKTPSPPQ